MRAGTHVWPGQRPGRAAAWSKVTRRRRQQYSRQPARGAARAVPGALSRVARVTGQGADTVSSRSAALSPRCRCSRRVTRNCCHASDSWTRTGGPPASTCRCRVRRQEVCCLDAALLLTPILRRLTPPPRPATDGDDAQMERYSDRVRRAQAPPRRVTLHEVVGRLESRYFPRELWATCVGVVTCTHW